MPETPNFQHTIKIDIGATSQRELMEQLFRIFQMHNRASGPDNPLQTAQTSADYTWTVEATG